MANLTSVYKDHPYRDILIQSCIDYIDKISISFPNLFSNYGFLEIFDSEGGTQPPKSKFSYKPQKDFIRFLQIRDFSSDKTPTFIPSDKNNKLCNEDDILLGRYGASVGKILTGKKGAYNVACTRIIIVDENIIFKPYIFYLLHSSIVQNALKNITRGAQAGFNKGDLEKIKLKIPEKKTQENIFNILYNLDKQFSSGEPFRINISNKNELLSKILKYLDRIIKIFERIRVIQKEVEFFIINLKNLRQSILQEAVQGKLVPQNPNDEPASELLKKIKAEKEKLIKEGKIKKEKPLPEIKTEEIPFEIPKNWKWVRFEEILYSCEYGTSERAFATSDEIPVLRMNNIKDGRIIYNDLKYIHHQCKDLPRLFLENDDLLFNRTNSFELVGKTGVFKVTNEKYTFASYLIRISSNKKLLISDFINIYMNSSLFRKYQIEPLIIQQCGQANVSGSKLKNCLIPIPPLAEQKRIVEKVDELMKLCDELEQQIAESKTNTEKLMQSVLQEAFKK